MIKIDIKNKDFGTCGGQADVLAEELVIVVANVYALWLQKSTKNKIFFKNIINNALKVGEEIYKEGLKSDELKLKTLNNKKN